MAHLVRVFQDFERWYRDDPRGVGPEGGSACVRSTSDSPRTFVCRCRSPRTLAPVSDCPVQLTGVGPVIETGPEECTTPVKYGHPVPSPVSKTYISLTQGTRRSRTVSDLTTESRGLRDLHTWNQGTLVVAPLSGRE